MMGRADVVCSNFDQRRNAKAGDRANDVAEGEATAANEPKQFSQIVAAE